MSAPQFFNGHLHGPVPTSSNPDPFPTNNSMFMFPGNYLWDGEGYDCTAHGRYLFQRSNGSVEQRCVIEGADPLTVCRMMDWCHVHGVAHDPITGNALSVTGRSQRLRLTCGYLTNFMVWLLPQIGLEARRVDVLTDEPPNGWDDGHIVTEVKIDGLWRMMDITTGYYFTDTSGEILSVAEFVEAINGEFPFMNRLSGAYKTNCEVSGVVDFGLNRDIRLSTEVELQTWYRRVYQRIV